MLVPEQLASHSERLALQAFGLVELSLTLERSRQIVEAKRDAGMSVAEPALNQL